MNISDNGLKSLIKHEGVRYQVYDDKTSKTVSSYQQVRGYPTIGVGHLIPSNQKSSFAPYLRGRKKLSESQVMDLLRKDIQRFENPLRAKITARMTQSMWDAIVSLAFNVGNNSKSLKRVIGFINAGDYRNAALAIKNGPKTSKGVLIPSLQRRRSIESVLFARDGLKPSKTYSKPIVPVLGIGVLAVLVFKATQKLGSKSLEDILFLAETRGGRYWVKIAKEVNPDTESKNNKKRALIEILSGNAFLSGNEPPDLEEKSLEELAHIHFDVFGFFMKNDSYDITTSNTVYGGRDQDEIKYLALKHIFKDSIFSGKKYYIRFCPPDMSDPIESDQFKLRERDVHVNFVDIFKATSFYQRKYGNLDKCPEKLAYENLVKLGYPDMQAIINASADTHINQFNRNRFDDWAKRMKFNVDDFTIKVLIHCENIFSDVWTVPARKHARKIAGQRK